MGENKNKGQTAGPNDPTIGDVQPNDPQIADSESEFLVVEGETRTIPPKKPSVTKPPKKKQVSLKSLRKGQRLGAYVIDGFLGRGGMGVVYKAKDPNLDIDVAIKTMIGDSASKAMKLRFIDEGRAVAKLKHPNIVGVKKTGYVKSEDGELIYIAMDFIKGKDLSKIIDEDELGSNAFERSRNSAELMSKVARALDYAHSKKIIHRDVKPENILVDEEGEPYLTDFGLARIVREQEKRLTKSHEVMGTPKYMSPEQAASTKEADRRTDVWALGAIMYEILTGVAPFDGTTPLNVLAKIMKDDPVQPRKLDNRIDKDIETITMKALEKELEKRYQTAGELAEELERYMRGDPIKARPVGFLGRQVRKAKRQPAKYGSIAAGLLAIAVAAPLTIQAMGKASEAEEQRQEESARAKKADAKAKELEEKRQKERERKEKFEAIRKQAMPFYQNGKNIFDEMQTAKRDKSWDAVGKYQKQSLEELAKAIDIIEELPAEYNIPNAFYLRGKILKEQGKIDAADKDLSKTIELQPQNALALYEKAMLLVVKNENLVTEDDISKAKKQYDKLVKLGIAKDKANLVKAVIHYYKGEHEEAFNLLNSLISNNSRHGEALFQRARNYLKTNSMEAAIKDYEICVELNDRDWQSHNSLAVCYSMTRQFKDANEHYEKTIELNPKFPIAYENFGRVLYEQRKFQEAIDTWQKSLDHYSKEEDKARVQQLIGIAEQQIK